MRGGLTVNKSNSLLRKDHNGEFIYNELNSHIGKKYKADTPLDKSFVPYLIILFCAIVDASVFISLFKMISYDSPFMLGIEVAGFLFAFDVVPLYLGIQLRRLKQGISKDRFILWLALVVCVLACVMNIALRLTTIEQMSPDLSAASTSYFGTVTEEMADRSVDPTAIALTIFGIGLPMLTSIGSFFISFLTYNPLKVRKRAVEELLNEKNDEIRRLDAILSEYDADSEFAEHLREDDEGKYEEMKKMQRAVVLNYCEYVRQRLKEHLANPTAINALSEETGIAILERLDWELAALDRAEIPKVYTGSASKETTLISSEAAA